MLNIVCVKQGIAYGPEYVNILADMVRRNLPEGTKGRFICLTDNAKGLDNGVEPWGLPPYVKGWWSKLYLFREDLFPKGDRILYFDLDTIIAGEIDELIVYDGPFAALRDFYRPDGLGSGVMLWEAGWGGEIWERWKAEGRPEVEGGDQAWIERFVGQDFVRLQDRFPGLFCSFKEDCRPSGPPRASSVVCFHGYPKPHETSFEWARQIWRLDGWAKSSVKLYCNTADEKLSHNIRSASARSIEWVKEEPAHDRQAIIVGGGPSLLRSLPWLQYRAHQATIFALNNAANFLRKHGVKSDWQVVMDARPRNAEFIQPNSADGYLLASQCDPSLFNRAKAKARLWHAWIPGMENDIPEDRRSKDTVFIGGGTSVLTRAMSLAYTMGYRTLHLYGVDSSFEGQSHHAYGQMISEADAPKEVILNDRKFMAAQWMIGQVYEFQHVAAMLAEQDCTITVHGDGLLPAVASAMERASNLAA